VGLCVESNDPGVVAFGVNSKLLPVADASPAVPARPSQAKSGDYRPLGGTVTEEGHRFLPVCILSSHGTPGSDCWGAVLMHRAVSPVASAASTGFAFINVRPVWEGLGG
jgi:hypothetical protein